MVVLFWTALGVFSSLELHIESSFSPRKDTWLHSLFLEITFTTICAALTPAVLWLARRFRIDEKPYWRNASVHVIAGILFTIISKSIWTPAVYMLDGRPLTWMKFFWSIIYSFDYCVVLYWMVVLASYLVDYYRRYHQGLLDASRLNTELAQAQLRWLKSRLHPHFLFNALNTISALVREDPSAAEKMIARLSDLLRLSLRESGVQEVTLGQELDYLNLYLDIERARFAERLAIEFNIEEGTEDALVPSLVLQPLVENAIRHGIAPRLRSGRISIAASRHGSRLCVRISDDGVGLKNSPDTPVTEGVGLSTVRGRLERLYGRSQSLILRSAPAGGVEVVVSLPFTRIETQAPEVMHETAPHVGG
jgi:two-component sensor histidine kinase